ncbi:MAG: hypothetical protein ACFE7E_08475, partial [Candidatus Hodarchaeota archaeon]
DYQRDGPALWRSSRRTFEDPKTKYLFDPQSLHETPFKGIVVDMQKYGLSKKPKKDANIWRTVGVTFYKKWSGDPKEFLQDCNWDAPTILDRLKSDRHPLAGRWRNDYPYLRGPKIGPLWLRMLKDNVGITQMKNMDMVPIPVDVHIGRATLATGVVRGRFEGKLNNLFDYVRRAWFDSVKGLSFKNRPMIALDVDEPLWHLSKYGCKYRDKVTGYCPKSHRCEARDFCIRGKIRIEGGNLELET